MRILITGATGLVGRSLLPLLLEKEMEVIVLTSDILKQNLKQNVLFWDANRQIFPKNLTHPIDAVIHLAGANVGKQRWTAQFKQEIIDSRVKTSAFLLHQLIQQNNLPKKYITASGTDFYPNPGNEQYAETHKPGTHFLATVCEKWEAAAKLWEDQGCQTSIIRTPVVLAHGSAFLQKMMQSSGLGIIPTTGNPGNQLSWVHVKDLCSVYLQAATESMPGIWNAVAPEATGMLNFVQTIDKVRNKKTLHPNVPGWVLKLVLGEMGTLACSDQQVSAEKLLSHGFRYQYPTVAQALHDILNTKA